MKVFKYAAIAEKTDQLEPKTPVEPNYKVAPILGLAGEIGSLLTELKKGVREPQRKKRITKKQIREELGDILWYAATIARRAGLDFQRDVLFKNLKRVQKNPGLYMPLVDDDDIPGKALHDAIETDAERTAETFKSYQDHAAKSARQKKGGEAEILYLASIWKNTGDLLKKIDPETANFSAVEKRIVSQVLGDVMWYVAGFATLYRLSLNSIAKENGEKAWSKFAPKEERERTPLYDQCFPKREQFPRQFDVIFAPAPSGTKQAVMLINGIRVGDPLRDNAYSLKNKKTRVKTDMGEIEIERETEIDGYRFHDSIHFAFVAILGWSPVMRGLMKRKRKKRPDIDDAEDGARAQIVEELIVKLAHSYAVGIDEKKLLDDEKTVGFDLLKQINNLTDGLEVAGSRKKSEGLKAVENWEWQDAILAGFHVYNELRRKRKGRIRVDLNKREIKFFKLKPGEEDVFPFIE